MDVFYIFHHVSEHNKPRVIQRNLFVILSPHKNIIKAEQFIELS